MLRYVWVKTSRGQYLRMTQKQYNRAYELGNVSTKTHRRKRRRRKKK